MGYQKEHTCAICKEKFISYNYRGMFCPECRVTRKKAYIKEYLKKYRNKENTREYPKECKKKKQEETKKRILSIAEIHRLANAAGMTYGQYTAMLEMQKEAKK